MTTSINMSSPQTSTILDTVVTLKLTSSIHYTLNVSSSPTHPPAKCSKTAANLKAELIISDFVTDALRLDSNWKSLSVPGMMLVFYCTDFTTAMQCYLVGGLLAMCLGKPLWLSLVFWLSQLAVPLSGLFLHFLWLKQSYLSQSVKTRRRKDDPSQRNFPALPFIISQTRYFGQKALTLQREYLLFGTSHCLSNSQLPYQSIFPIPHKTSDSSCWRRNLECFNIYF